MGDRPLGGAALARKPLHLIWVLDVSGSMAADGKIQSLNSAMRASLEHLGDVADENPHLQLYVRVLTFATSCTWHVPEPTSVHDLAWTDVAVEPRGITEMGIAMRELAWCMHALAASDRGLPPAIVLVSDGQPTDVGDPTFATGLGELLAQPWGAKATRMAVGIGRDADDDALREFIGNPDWSPIRASNPQQLIDRLRIASTSVVRESSLMHGDLDPLGTTVVPGSVAGEGDGQSLVWDV